MIVNLFRHTQAISILSLLGLSLFLWMGISFQETTLNTYIKNPFFDYFFKPIINYKFLERIIVTALILWQSVFINKLFVGQKILSSNSFYPAFFYFILMSLWPQTIHLSPELVALSFILISINKTISLYLSKEAYSTVFEVSFFGSFAVLFHPPFIIFIPMIWIGMSIFSQTEWRHWILSLLALFSPWIILLSLKNYFNIQTLKLVDIFSVLFTEKQATNINTIETIGIGMLILLFLICSNELMSSLSRKNIKARKSYIYLLWFFPFSVVYFFISPSIIWYKLIIVNVPFTAILSNYFYYNQKSKRLNFIGFSFLVFLFTMHFS